MGKKENGIINNNWSKNGNSVKGKELGAFSGPLDLEFYNNKIYISDNDNHRILKLDLSGKVMGWIGKSNKSNRNKSTSVTSKTIPIPNSKKSQSKRKLTDTKASTAIRTSKRFVKNNRNHLNVGELLHGNQNM